MSRGGIEYRVIVPARQASCWRNSFLGIDSWAPLTFKNTGSDRYLKKDVKMFLHLGYLINCQKEITTKDDL
jgi:hypothetical protein